MRIYSVITSDGSTSLFHKHFDEHYHSIHGAIQESQHVFIDAGFNQCITKNGISIFEMGFGTGLNALLTALQAENNKLEVHYTSIEKYPLSINSYLEMNFCSVLKDSKCKEIYETIYNCNWEEECKLTDYFYLTKLERDIQNFQPNSIYDVIYFDAFAPSSQPELWTIDVFQKMYNLLKEDGLLVTYCAKGYVKRNLKSAGFIVETLPGPKGKREMTRARRV